MLVRLAAGPLVGMLADLLGSLRLPLATCAALAAGTAAAFLLANTFWLLFFIALVQAAALAPTTSIADALSVNAARPQIAAKPFEYGWIRGSGSAAFVLGTLIIGQLISRDDLTPIIWMNVALLAAAAGATALLPRVTIRPEPHDGGSPVLADLHGLLKISRFQILILVSALVYGSHAMHDSICCDLVECCRHRYVGHKRPMVGSRSCRSRRVFCNWSSLTRPVGRAWCGCSGSGCRNHTVVHRRREHLRFGALNSTAATRIDFRPASSCMHAHDGDSCASQAGRNGPSPLRVWLRFGDCRPDFVVRNSLCQVRSCGLLSDGPSLRRRSSLRVVWLR
jgi:hypothetical protein